MTKVVVNPGICGFTSIIIVTKLARERFSIEISTDCKHVSKLAESLAEVNPFEIMKSMKECVIFQEASKHLSHITCPVPVGILKALEVEAGLALPRDVCIHFEDSKENINLRAEKSIKK